MNRMVFGIALAALGQVGDKFLLGVLHVGEPLSDLLTIGVLQRTAHGLDRRRNLSRHSGQCRRGMGEWRIRPDRGLPVERPDPDHPSRLARLVRQDRETSVDLQRIRRDQLGGNPAGDLRSDLRFAARGGAEDADNRHQRILPCVS